MNKKSLVGIIVAVVVIGGYAVLSWVYGQAVHARFNTWAQALEKQPVPMVRIARRTHDGGIFSSVEVVTLAVNANLFRSSPPDATPTFSPATDVTTVAGETRELFLTVRNVVNHGPLPDLMSIGTARIETTIAWPRQAQAEIDKVFGGRDPFVLTTQLGLLGGATSRLVSPAVEYTGESGTTNWRGVDGTLTMSGNLDSIRCNVTAPGVDVEASDTQIHMEQLTFTCDGKRAFEVLYVGTMNFEIAALQVASRDKLPFTADQLHYAVDARAQGDFIDLALRIGADALNIEQYAVKDVHYDFSVKHVHGPTYAALSRKMQALTQTGGTPDPNSTTAVMTALREFGPELLGHAPAIVIDRLGFSMPEGEFGITGSAHLTDFARDDFATPAALVGKIDATADIWIAEGLIGKVAAATPVRPEETSLTPRAREASMREQIGALEQQGFVTRTDGQLRSRVEFRNGALSANGKPLGGPPPR